MRLFIFENIIGNLCSGDYYFLADDEDQATRMANDFADKHNRSINNNPNYIIEWDKENVKEMPLNSGYFPINRVSVYMEK